MYCCSVIIHSIITVTDDINLEVQQADGCTTCVHTHKISITSVSTTHKHLAAMNKVNSCISSSYYTIYGNSNKNDIQIFHAELKQRSYYSTHFYPLYVYMYCICSHIHHSVEIVIIVWK